MIFGALYNLNYLNNMNIPTRLSDNHLTWISEKPKTKHIPEAWRGIKGWEAEKKSAIVECEVTILKSKLRLVNKH